MPVLNVQCSSLTSTLRVTLAFFKLAFTLVLALDVAISHNGRKCHWGLSLRISLRFSPAPSTACYYNATLSMLSTKLLKLVQIHQFIFKKCLADPSQALRVDISVDSGRIKSSPIRPQASTGLTKHFVGAEREDLRRAGGSGIGSDCAQLHFGRRTQCRLPPRAASASELLGSFAAPPPRARLPPPSPP